MEHSFWHQKWQSNQIGFHQEDVHPEFVRYFPSLKEGARVLVPLCGKSKDMIWLAQQGYQVVGVELSEIAAKDFLKENGLTAAVSDVSMKGSVLKRFDCNELTITFYVGDFFAFDAEPFDGLYDRAALIALPPEMRTSYVEHTKGLLIERAQGLVITTVYDQTKASGPPFSVSDEETQELWGSALTFKGEIELIDAEPRWKSKGLTSFKEKIWAVG